MSVLIAAGLTLRAGSGRGMADHACSMPVAGCESGTEAGRTSGSAVAESLWRRKRRILRRGRADRESSDEQREVCAGREENPCSGGCGA